MRANREVERAVVSWQLDAMECLVVARKASVSKPQVAWLGSPHTDTWQWDRARYSHICTGDWLQSGRVEKEAPRRRGPNDSAKPTRSYIASGTSDRLRL